MQQANGGLGALLLGYTALEGSDTRGGLIDPDG